MTHQAPTLALKGVLVIGTYGRTDTMCENNDHLFSRGLVGQQ